MKHQHLSSDITATALQRIGFFALLLFFTIADQVFCQDKTLGNPVKNGPVITFNTTSYDFGTIKYGDRAVHFFVFSNDGESPLVILNVRAACGCTVQSWPKAPLASGMKDSIRVEYNTKIKGTFNKTITVQSNASNTLTDLKISGNVAGKKK